MTDTQEFCSQDHIKKSLLRVPQVTSRARDCRGSSAWGEGKITEGTSTVRHARRGGNQEAGVRAPWEGTASGDGNPFPEPKEPTSYFTTLLGRQAGRQRAERAGPVRKHPSPQPLCTGRLGQPGLGASRAGRMEDDGGPECGKPDFVL